MARIQSSLVQVFGISENPENTTEDLLANQCFRSPSYEALKDWPWPGQSLVWWTEWHLSWRKKAVVYTAHARTGPLQAKRFRCQPKTAGKDNSGHLRQSRWNSSPEWSRCCRCLKSFQSSTLKSEVIVVWPGAWLSSLVWSNGSKQFKDCLILQHDKFLELKVDSIPMA